MPPVAALSNEELLAEVSRLASRERAATVALIRCLMEVDSRRLYLGEGYSSLFTFCTQALHLSEHAALGRIEVARSARRLPDLLTHLEDGSLTLTNARMLAPHLTEANSKELLAGARHRSKRDMEEIVARLRPQPDVRTSVRKLPSAHTAGPLSTAPPRGDLKATLTPTPPEVNDHHSAPVVPMHTPPRPVVAALAPERYKVQFTASRPTHDKLRYAQDLLRHAVPSGDIAEIFDRALTSLIEQLEKQKCAATLRPRERLTGESRSRTIPAPVKREVWRRDDGRCAFVGTRGRCTERGFLEFHHVIPFAAGGDADAINIELRCRAHNIYEAELFFGTEIVRECSGMWG